MKLCPQCKSKYTDDSLAFCLQDGTPLVDEAAEDAGEPTVAFSEVETVESKKGDGRIGIDIPRSEDPEAVPSSPAKVTAKEPATRSGLLRTTLFAAAILLTLFLIVAVIVAIVYLNSGPQPAANSAQVSFEANNGNASPDTTPNPTPEETLSPDQTPTASPIDEASPTPEDDIDLGDTKDFVRRHLLVWKRLTEAQRLDELMSFYSDPMDRYYNRTDVSKAFVRRDKAAAFERLDSISITISNLDVTPVDGGEKAIAEFDKGWRFERNGRVTTGRARSRFDLKRYGDSWLITGERDLKVY